VAGLISTSRLARSLAGKVEVPTDDSSDLLIIKFGRLDMMIQPRSKKEGLGIIEQWKHAESTQ
jgi:hypothetical protein